MQDTHISTPEDQPLVQEYQEAPKTFQSGLRQELKVIEGSINRSITFQKLSPTFVKVPLNLAGIPFRLQRAYVGFLDCKAQTIEGTFHNNWDHAPRRFYQRLMKKLVDLGWASRVSPGVISLRTYQHVWRSMGIGRLNKQNPRGWKDTKRKASGTGWVFYKITTDSLDGERAGYYMQIEKIIRTSIAKRMQAQIRWRLNKRQTNHNQATFTSSGSAALFGYRSPASGSKLRKRFFEVIPSNDKPYFNRVNGRYELPTKQIAI